MSKCKKFCLYNFAVDILFIIIIYISLLILLGQLSRKVLLNIISVNETFFYMKNFHKQIYLFLHLLAYCFLHKSCLLVFAIAKLMIFIINRSQNHVSRGQNKLFKYRIKCIGFEVKRTFRRGS